MKGPSPARSLFGSDRLPTLLVLVCSWAVPTTAHAAGEQRESFKVLVFSKTTGFRHGSIEAGVRTIRELGESHGFEVDATEDSAAFADENLRKYQALVFMNTSGTVFNDEQRAAFKRFIQAGNGFAGVHLATGTEREWEWYRGLVGTYFRGHPAIQNARVIVEDRRHISTAHLPGEFTFRDEWYEFHTNPRPDVKVLLSLDESSYKPLQPMKDHPIAWYREYDGGRSWYTALGHLDETYADERFRKHLLGGVVYAATGGPASGRSDQARAASKQTTTP